MKKIIAILFLFGFAIFSSAFAQTPEITNGLNYLTSAQNPDGSFGDETVNINMPFYSTTEAVNAFKALQETGTTTYTNAVQWLSSYPADNTGYIAGRMSALSGGNTDLSSDLTLLLQWRNTDKGWGGYDDYLSSNYHTALTLQVFKAVNYSDLNLIGNTLGYLTSTQNTDGGWGFYKGDDSNVYMTAMVSYTLQQFSETLSIATAINKATSYLVIHQNRNGGFGSSPSTVYESSLAYMALTNEITDATVLGNAINYLKATQLPNGFWEDDPYSIALALRALANVKPNLSIVSNDITFSNSTPTVGRTITITANIRNPGPAQAPSAGSGYITVQFFSGDPNAGGILIGATTIPSITAYGSSQASISYTIPTASSKTIFVRIDPLNSVVTGFVIKNMIRNVVKIRQINLYFLGQTRGDGLC